MHPHTHTLHCTSAGALPRIDSRGCSAVQAQSLPSANRLGHVCFCESFRGPLTVCVKWESGKREKSVCVGTHRRRLRGEREMKEDEKLTTFAPAAFVQCPLDYYTGHPSFRGKLEIPTRALPTLTLERARDY